MKGIESALKMSDDGLLFYEAKEEASRQLLTDLSNPSTRKEALRDIDAQCYPTLLRIGSNAPQEFLDLLNPVPNREKAHTLGQPLVLSHRFDCHRAMQECLGESGSELRKIMDQAISSSDNKKMIADYEAQIRLLPTSTVEAISTVNLLTCQFASRLFLFEKYVEEMDKITDRIKHMKHVWDDDTRGTVLVVPETEVLHRRLGDDTAQVVWHADTIKGCIVFCLLNNQTIPHRVLFSERGTSM